MKLFAPHLVDFYKTGHYRQYPENTETVYSNITARSDRLAKMLDSFDHKVVVAGIAPVIRWMLVDLWNDTFFQQPRERVLRKYQRRMDSALGAGAVTTDHLAALYDLGYLPLRVKALPEGARVNLRVPFVTIENTLPEFYWLTNYVETALSSEIWKSVNNATIAFEFRRLLEEYGAKTGTPRDFIDFQAHDFSLRGVGGVYDGASHGVGHLFSFKGSDNVPSIDFLEDYYDAEGEFLASGVPATEHSVMCMGGKETEIETYRRLIQDVYPSGIVSIVSDTWDYWNVLTNIAVKLKDTIENRKPDALGLAKVVFRPDSGDPELILCGDPSAEPGTPAFKGSLQLLWDIFGGTVNEQGFKVLNPRVGLIYGDSITLPRAESILRNMLQNGWASGNVVFGVGSFTYQFHTRDTFGIAMKTTWGSVNGHGVELMKDPVTDRGTKKSAKGLLRVEKVGEDYVLHEQQTREQEQSGELRVMFEDGFICETPKVSEIRSLLLSEIKI
jgi:nicotinamide phosphoribosyltransferase